MLDVDFSSNGSLIASGSRDGTLRLWQPRVKGVASLINAHTSAAVHSVCFSCDNRFVLTSSNDKSVKMWELQTQRFHCSFAGHMHWVRSAHFSPDSRLVLSGGDDKTVRLWDVKSGRNVHTFFDHTEYVLFAYSIVHSFHPFSAPARSTPSSSSRTGRWWHRRAPTAP